MKYYVSKFLVSGRMEFLGADVLDTLTDAISDFEEESKNLKPGIEIILGCGDEGDDWFPPEG